MLGILDPTAWYHIDLTRPKPENGEDMAQRKLPEPRFAALAVSIRVRAPNILVSDIGTCNEASTARKCAF
jgi:hypothetical protein